MLTLHGIYTTWAPEMLTYNQDEKRAGPWWVFLLRILGVALPIALFIFLITQKPLIHRVEKGYPTEAILVGWVVGMLSYHQDAKLRLTGWAFISQLFSIVCLIALVVFGFTRGSWVNFLIAPPVIWLHIQFSTRWWARPGAWW